MSQFKSFKDMSTYITLEDEDIVVETPAGEGQMDVSDVIEEQAVQDEVNGDIAKIEDAQLQVEEAMEVVDELEEQIENNEQIIEESPEQVTEDTVEVAQEAVMISLAKLGYTMSEFGITRMSQEDRSTSPVQALKLSTEGVKEVLVAIKDKIVAMFKKVIEWIKALFSKVAGLFKANEKKAIALEQKIKQAKNLKFLIPIEDIVQALSPLAGIITVTGGKIKLMDIVDFISIDYMGNFGKAFSNFFEEYQKEFAKNAVELIKMDYDKLTSKVSEIMDSINVASIVSNKILSDKLMSDENNGSQIPLIIYNDHIISIVDSDESSNTSTLALASTRINPEEIKNASNYTNMVPTSVGDLLEYARLGKRVCAGSKAYIDKVRYGSEKMAKGVSGLNRISDVIMNVGSTDARSTEDIAKLTSARKRYMRQCGNIAMSLSRMSSMYAVNAVKQYITYGKAFLTVGNNLYNLASK